MYDQRHPQPALVQFTLSAAQRCVGGDVGLSPVVTGKDEDRLLGKPQFLQPVADHPDPVVDALEHCGQVRVVVTGPVMQRITVMTVILAKVTPLAGARTRPMFLAIFRHQLGLAVENRMGGVMAQVEEKRPVLISLDKVHRLEIHSVDEVFGLSQPVFGDVDPANRLFSEDVRPEIRSVADTFHLPGNVPAKAVGSRHDLVFCPVKLVSGQVPLADHARGVAIPAQHLGQRDVTRGKGVSGIGPQVVEDSDPRRILTSEKSRSVRGTDRRRGVGLGETHSILCQPIQVWRLVEPVAVTTQLTPAKIVGQNKDDIRPIRGDDRLGHQNNTQNQTTASHDHSTSLREYEPLR